MVTTEAKRYNEAWATGDYDPMVGLVNVRDFYLRGVFRDHKTVLDVGCGTGAAVRYHREIGGKEAYGVDFAKPAGDFWKRFDVDRYCVVGSAEEIPFRDNHFDIVTCTDVFEHIPEENVSRVLDEMYRVGKRDFLFLIALKKANIKMPDGSEPHICIKPPEWWVEKVHKAGFKMPAKMAYTAVLCIKAQKRCESILTLRTTAIKPVRFVL